LDCRRSNIRNWIISLLWELSSISAISNSKKYCLVEYIFQGCLHENYSTNLFQLCQVLEKNITTDHLLVFLEKLNLLIITWLFILVGHPEKFCCFACLVLVFKSFTRTTMGVRKFRLGSSFGFPRSVLNNSCYFNFVYFNYSQDNLTFILFSW